MEKILEGISELKPIFLARIIQNDEVNWHVGVTTINKVEHPAIFLERLAAVLEKKGVTINKIGKTGSDLLHIVPKTANSPASSMLGVTHKGHTYYVSVFHGSDDPDQIRVQSREKTRQMTTEQKNRLQYKLLALSGHDEPTFSTTEPGARAIKYLGKPARITFDK